MNLISKEMYTEHEILVEEIRGQLIVLRQELSLAQVVPSARVIPVGQRHYVCMWLVALPRRQRWVGNDNELYFRRGRWFSREWQLADYTKRDVRGLRYLRDRLQQQINQRQELAR